MYDIDYDYDTNLTKAVVVSNFAMDEILDYDLMEIVNADVDFFKRMIVWANKKMGLKQPKIINFNFEEMYPVQLEDENVRKNLGEKGWGFACFQQKDLFRITIDKQTTSFESCITKDKICLVEILLELVSWSLVMSALNGLKKQEIIQLIKTKICSAYKADGKNLFKAFSNHPIEMPTDKRIPNLYLELYNKLPPDQQKSLMEALGIK